MNSQKLREARDKWKRRKEAAAFYGVSSYLDASWLQIDENENVEVSLSATISTLPSPLEFIETLHLDPVEEGEEENTDDEDEGDENRECAFPQPCSSETQSKTYTTEESLIRNMSSRGSEDLSSCTCISQNLERSKYPDNDRKNANETAGEERLDTYTEHLLSLSFDDRINSMRRRSQSDSDDDSCSLDGFFHGQFSFEVQDEDQRHTTRGPTEREVADQPVESLPDLKATCSTSSYSQATEGVQNESGRNSLDSAQRPFTTSTNYSFIEERIQVTPVATALHYWKPEKRKRTYWKWSILVAILILPFLMLHCQALSKDCPVKIQEKSERSTQRRTPKWRQLEGMF